ncbi:MAG: adenylate/guanylate cyclase domain-containing protein [Candidatus Zixiibacteriota bacterium]|jgi:class 3 adenylate cyclase
MDDKPRKFRKTLALKLTIVIEAIIILAIVTVTAVHLRRELTRIDEDARARMNLTVALIQRAFTTLDRAQFENWLNEIYRVRFNSADYDLTPVYVLVLRGQEEVVVASSNPRIPVVDAAGRKLEPLDYYKINAPNLGRINAHVTDPDTGQARYLISVGYSIAGYNWLVQRQILTAAAVAGVFILAGLIVAVAASVTWTKPIKALAAGLGRVQDGDFDYRIPVRRGDELGHVAYNFNLMAEGLRDREFVKSTFKRYVTKQVVEKILSQKDAISLAGEKREVTVLFSDLEGFTAFSERHEPSEVVALLNEYLAIMIDIIFLYEGALDKFLGDGVMAYWNAPLDQDHAPLKSAIAAIEMQSAIATFNKKRSKENKEPVYAGIGITTGEVVAGNIGSEKKMEYTVIGDKVNLAQRIEGQTDRGQILIDNTTYQHIKDYCYATPLPPSRVKGKKDPVQTYVLHGLNHSAGPFVASGRTDFLLDA